MAISLNTRNSSTVTCPGSTDSGSWNTLNVSVIAAESMAKLSAVRFDAITGQLRVADASTRLAARGFILDAVAAGSSARLYVDGDTLNGFSGLTPGDDVYLRDGGLISSTPSSTGLIQIVGCAMSATEILINLSDFIAIIQ